MPIYDRECKACGETWELEEPMEPPKDAEPAKCPKCGAQDSVRLITGRRAFVLVGSRWARDGYG